MTTIGTVLVTGGASGLGAAVVDAVAAQGGRPVVLDRLPTGRDDDVCVDLSDSRAAEEAVRYASEQGGGIDDVVTGAGIDD